MPVVHLISGPLPLSHLILWLWKTQEAIHHLFCHNGPNLKGVLYHQAEALCPSTTAVQCCDGPGSISRGGVLAHRGGFGTFGWKGTGRWTDSEAGKTYVSAAATPPTPGVPLTGPAGSVALSRAEGTA